MKELNDAIEAAIKNHQDGGDKPTAITEKILLRNTNVEETLRELLAEHTDFG